MESSTPSYINVTVSAKAVFLKMTEKATDTEPATYETVPGIEVEIKMDKASGISKIFYDTTNSEGSTGYHFHTFQLYREQPINLQAMIYGETPDELLDYQISSDYQQITWEQVHSQADFGESLQLAPYVLTITATI